jgi:hypothetical protein
MPDAALVQDILQGLVAYGQQYGLPDSTEQLRGVVGSILNVYWQADNLPLTPREASRIIEAVLAGFDSQSLVSTVVEDTKQALAAQAHQWQREVEAQVTASLATYIHEYAPALTVDFAETAITSLMPLIKQGHFTKAEVDSLIYLLTDTLGEQLAATVGLQPEYVELAKTLALALSQQDMEAAVSETVIAYVQKFSPNLIEIGETLIEQALSAVLKNQVDFGLDVDLTLADKKLLIEEIYFKLNIMEQSPLPSKTAAEIANELQAEIQRFKEQQADELGSVDVTTGIPSESGLGLSSGWTGTGNRQPLGEPEE